MKHLKNVKPNGPQAQASLALWSLLREIPFLMVGPLIEEPDHPDSGYGPDFEIHVRWPGGETTLVGEYKGSGQPGVARPAIAALELYLQKRTAVTGVFAAPYISAKVMAMCAEHRMGAVDLSGNARLMFGNVFIDRSGKPNRFTEDRELKSIFTPKATRVLRVLLERPRHDWQVKTLAAEAKVSLGQASKVKQALERMAWLEPEAIRLRNPAELLTRWALQQRRIEKRRLECYSSRPPEHVEMSVAAACEAAQVKMALCGQSAAWRLAPMVRPMRSTSYVDGDLEMIARTVGLKEVDNGANVVLIQPRDEGVFYKSEQIGELPVVCPVQAYLDCMRFGGRGEGAADAILEQRLRPTW